MVNNKRYQKNYTYGNVAYDFEPQIDKKKKNINKNTVIKTKKSLKVKLKLITCVAVLFALSFLTLCRFATIIKITNDISTIKTELKKAQNANEDIKVKIAKFNNIKNIETVAVNKYGMVVPDSKSVVYVDVKPLSASVDMPKPTAFQLIQRLLGLIY